MSRRKGFTVLELVTALTVLALTATVAAAAVQAAGGAGSRVSAQRRASAADAAVRALLTDALRHQPPPSLVDAPLLAITPGADGPTVSFPSRGVVPPYGTGPVWRVTVARVGDSLVVDALPPTAVEAAPRHLALAGVSAMTVRVHDGAPGAAWRPDWPLAQRAPRAVDIAWTRDGQAAAPLRVLLAPLAGEGVP